MKIKVKKIQNPNQNYNISIYRTLNKIKLFPLEKQFLFNDKKTNFQS